MVGASTLHVRNSRVECENVQGTVTVMGTYTPPGGYSAKCGGAIASSREAQVTIEGSSIERCGAKESGGVLFHESALCAPRCPPNAHLWSRTHGLERARHTAACVGPGTGSHCGRRCCSACNCASAAVATAGAHLSEEKSQLTLTLCAAPIMAGGEPL